MLRLFTGIPLAGEARAALAPALERWRREYLEVRWVAAGDLHITLQFIGAWPATREAELIAALQSVKVTPFELAITGLQGFPSLRRPRTFFAPVSQVPPLAALAGGVAAALAPLGLAPEARAFTPHVTLARLHPPAPLPTAERATAWGACAVRGFNLYQTLAGHYHVRHTFPG